MPSIAAICNRDWHEIVVGSRRQCRNMIARQLWMIIWFISHDIYISASYVIHISTCRIRRFLLLLPLSSCQLSPDSVSPNRRGVGEITQQNVVTLVGVLSHFQTYQRNASLFPIMSNWIITGEYLFAVGSFLFPFYNCFNPVHPSGSLATIFTRKIGGAMALGSSHWNISGLYILWLLRTSKKINDTKFFSYIVLYSLLFFTLRFRISVIIPQITEIFNSHFLLDLHC